MIKRKKAEHKRAVYRQTTKVKAVSAESVPVNNRIYVHAEGRQKDYVDLLLISRKKRLFIFSIFFTSWF